MVQAGKQARGFQQAVVQVPGASCIDGPVTCLPSCWSDLVWEPLMNYALCIMLFRDIVDLSTIVE